MLEEARADGLDVTPDQYPYTASCSRIGSLLPRWACAGSDAEARARFDDPAARTRIAADVVARLKRFYGGELDRIRIASSTVRPDLAGATFAQIAAQRGAADPYADIVDFVLEMARSHPASSDTMCIFHTMCEADVLRIMAYPHTCIASDGWGVKMGAGHPHPRLYGTFPRVLGRYCRDQRLFPFAEAVRRMTSLPAARLGIADRGVLCKGAWADLTVLGPATVADTASFEAPHHYPVGIDYVIVNGQVVLDHGRHTGALPGVFIPRAR
jgi:dihydroorotase/N-acyl-D-amino-acid deacylase